MAIGTKGAAKKGEMGSLHDQLAKELSNILKNGETVTVTAGGETTSKVVRPSAAMLQVIRGFLKDNNVLCDEEMPSRPVGELTRALERFNEEEDDAPHFN